MSDGVFQASLCIYQMYAVHVRDTVRKTEQDYKVSTQNNTVEYTLKGLEPGGRYSITIRLLNMSKEASFTLNTGIAISFIALKKKMYVIKKLNFQLQLLPSLRSHDP